MAEDINVVDPTNAVGTDYTSWNAWENAEDGDITATGSDVQAVCECRGGADNSLVGDRAVANWTTDSTHWIEMRNHADEPTNGYYDSSRYYFDLDTDNDRMSFSEENIRIFGLQFHQSATGDTQFCLYSYFNGSGGIVDWRIYNNIFVLDDTTASSMCIQLGYVRSGTSNIYFFNNMIASEEDNFYYVANYDISVNLYFVNNTVDSIDIGIRISGTYYNGVVQNFRNNISYVSQGDNPFYPVETTGDYWVDDDAYNNYNHDNDTDTAHVARGTNGSGSNTFTFEDAANYDIRITSGDTGAKGKGENLYANPHSYPDWMNTILQQDIAGNDRGDSGNWDAGAYMVSTAQWSGLSYHLML